MLRAAELSGRAWQQEVQRAPGMRSWIAVGAPVCAGAFLTRFVETQQLIRGSWR
jgi:hypothetical protein